MNEQNYTLNYLNQHLLDAYEYETDIFYFEVMNAENLGLEHLQIEKVNQV